MKLSYSAKKIITDFMILIVVSWLIGLLTGISLVQRGFIGLVLIICSVVLMLIFRFVGDRWVSREIGEKGEFKIQTILSEMWPDGVRALHNLVLGDRGDIDHVAISPSGVWVIETKTLNGVFKKDDSRLKKGVAQAYAESKSVEKFLYSKNINVSVIPVLALAGRYTKVEFNEPVRGVKVLGSLDLKKNIVKSKSILTNTQVVKIVDVLKESQESL